MNLNLNLKEKVNPHDIFVLISCMFVILASNISITTGAIVLFCATFLYISFIVGKRLIKLYMTSDDNENDDNENFLTKLKQNINYEKQTKIGLLLITIGALFTVADLIWVSGVPLFDPASRKFLNVGFTAFAHLLPLGWAIVVSCVEMSKKKVFTYSLVFATLIALLGYRTQVIILLLSTIFVMYYNNKLSNKQVVYPVVGLALIVLVMSVLRFYALNIGGNPIVSRIQLTMNILDMVIQNFEGSLQGILHTAIFSSYGLIPGVSSGPRTIVANNLGIEGVTITPTIFGAVFADFGYLGLVSYFGLLGMFIGALHYISSKLNGIFMGIYAILIAYLLAGIETGLLDLDVVCFFGLGAFSLLYVVYEVHKLKNKAKNKK
ncbi:oligosaccharide repeat unit polymerase family protein [Methanococcus voltae]|uniref:Oligosaccharide repeat unit polymerase n=1 Tax=Methanococcus voltae (strain ATCC BAA-1334 / A3) TaxID=456320 RepID=D7DRV2_METV3|nr:oligosaccharide repeat unit polymerase family protein [Methanococcus voltae]MCS3901387.1 oligosaccharide repeat unit polymerase [Methanococcus voltae]